MVRASENGLTWASDANHLPKLSGCGRTAARMICLSGSYVSRSPSCGTSWPCRRGRVVQGGDDVAELANPLGDLLAGRAVFAQTGAAGRTQCGMGETAEEDTVVPVGVDFTKPSIARVYDALIGGKDNFAADRAMAQEMIDNVPHARDAALLNRAALARAVRFLATSAGIDQFIDLGSGLPTQENVHQVAQQQSPGAHVVYVDNDPMVLAHGRALLATDNTTRVISADFREPERVLGDPGLLELIDFSRPVGVMMCGILHHIGDSQNPRKLVADYSARLAAGSYLFVTQLCRTGSAGDAALRKISSARQFADAYRTLQEIQEFFAGWELIDPGGTFLPLWHPAGPRRSPAMLKDFERLHAGGLGRKNPPG